MVINWMLAQSCGGMGAGVMKLTIMHPMAEMVLLNGYSLRREFSLGITHGCSSTSNCMGGNRMIGYSGKGGCL